MFFSIAAVYASIKVLESQEYLKWAGVLVLTEFLSVYTIPTNVYFILGLAVWTFLVLLNPRYAHEYHLSWRDRKKKIIVFIISILLVGLLSVLVHLPFLNQMILEAGTEQQGIFATNSNFGMVLLLLPQVLQKMFSEPLIYFLPFALLGFCLGNTFRKSYRILPVIVFFLPLLIVLVSGTSGYPRNYLFNFPLFVIFLAGGLVWAGDFLGKMLRLKNKRPVAAMVLVILYSLTSLKAVAFDHYPSIQMPDGDLYRRMIEKHSDPLDLIIIADSRDYLYGRSVYKDNLENIISRNTLSGIKAVVRDPSSFKNFVFQRGKKKLEIFKNLPEEKLAVFNDVTGGKNIISVTDKKAVPLFSQDFESDAQWTIVSGKGRLTPITEHKLIGKQSLRIEADSQEDLIAYAIFPELFEVRKASYGVLVWLGQNLTGKVSVNHPELAVIKLDENKKYYQLLTGEINDGIKVFLKERNGWGNHPWLLISNIFKIPVGTYSATLWLKTPAGEAVLYDGFRFFIIEEP